MTVAELKAMVAAIPDILDDHIVIVDANHSDSPMTNDYSVSLWVPEEGSCYGEVWAIEDAEDLDRYQACIVIGGIH